MAQGRVGDKCLEDSQCSPGECCQILSPFPIVSKRQLEAIHLEHLLDSHDGSCQLYKTENATCNAFEKPNGYCGCGPGLRCHGEEVKVSEVLPHQPVGRSMIAPHPGYTWEYKCTPITTN
ncbi:uncharacterized protein LOC143289308 [Babylonia areolata]|uniref:uncharacterized protein LOC143289308 n=1 Tax=Babylonia areolata TaxID=304850 RepID=UPI003FD4EB24